jgi:hypothetical protein
MFPLLYSSEKFGAPIESIAKSHYAYCDKENRASTFFGKIRKRLRIPRNQDRPDQWQALSDCSGSSRGFADKVREIESRIELNLPHARPFGARLREQNIETANLSGPSPNGDDAGGAALSVSDYQIMWLPGLGPAATPSLTAASKAPRPGDCCGKHAVTSQLQSAESPLSVPETPAVLEISTPEL